MASVVDGVEQSGSVQRMEWDLVDVNIKEQAGIAERNVASVPAPTPEISNSLSSLIIEQPTTRSRSSSLSSLSSLSSISITDYSSSDWSSDDVGSSDADAQEEGIPDASLPLGYRLSHRTLPLERPPSLLQGLHCPTPLPSKLPTVHQAFARYPGTRYRKPPPVFPLPVFWEDGWEEKEGSLMPPAEGDSSEDENDLLRNRGDREFKIPFDIAHWYGLKKAKEQWDAKVAQKKELLARRRAKRASRGRIAGVSEKVQPKVKKQKPTKMKAEGGKEKVKPPKYRWIEKNTYYQRQPDRYPPGLDLPICQCVAPAASTPPTPASLSIAAERPALEKRSTRGSEGSLQRKGTAASIGCGDKCLNRAMLYTCPKNAPCREFCQNQPLHQLKGHRMKRHGVDSDGEAGSEIFWTGNRGFGLRAKQQIKQGEFVIDYRGEIIGINECYRRVYNIYKDSKNFYFLQYSDFEVLDAGRKGNEARFMNHSCDPNTKVVKYKYGDLDEYEIGFFALREISPGEELTYDYGWQDFGKSDPMGATTAATTFRQPCFCGAGPDKCRGTLGGKKKPVEKEKKEKNPKQGKKVRQKKKQLPTPSESRDGGDWSDVSSLTDLSEEEDEGIELMLAAGKRKERDAYDGDEERKRIKIA
ncbi:hypothetical protein BT69DRAFT_1348426 [Atractiella rhizophila]|nr:hypothetical protein BT69DRAFT_1348426 [Atractiella rhizophila]